MTKLIPLFALAVCSSPLLLAGPPLICHRVEIGTAKSLPWTETAAGWQGTVPSYDLNRLVTDTLALLTPQAPIAVRRETMRRAAIYSAKDARLAYEIAARLNARALNAEAAGKSDPLAWYDAGMWIESVRQASFIYRYDMLSKEEKAAWQIRKGLAGMDGYEWVRKAVAGGGQGMNETVKLIEEYRNADRQRGGSSE